MQGLKRVYVGRRRSHLGDRITVWSEVDGDGVVQATEIVMETEPKESSDGIPLVLELDE